MPESVKDRPTKAHEYIFLLTKSADYFYDAEAVKEPGAEPERQRYDRIGGVNGGNVRHGEQGMIGASVIRNRRSVWTMATKPFSEAHFATFPPELPETCINAGTSEWGCCAKCGSPWERIVENSRVPKEKQSGKPWLAQTEGIVLGRDATPNCGLSNKSRLETHTLGWRPTCTCDAGDPVPCVVCDPFSGAGTVRMVAMELGRHFIGAELNPEYIKIGYKRTWMRDAQLTLFEPTAEQQLWLEEKGAE